MIVNAVNALVRRHCFSPPVASDVSLKQQVREHPRAAASAAPQILMFSGPKTQTHQTRNAGLAPRNLCLNKASQPCAVHVAASRAAVASEPLKRGR